MNDTLAKLRALHLVDALVHLDFETFHSADYSLSKMTNEAYVRDPRFEVLGVAVRVGRGERLWLEEWDFAAWARSFDWSRVALDAHHTQFDGFILGGRYGIQPGFLCCTLSMARALHSGEALDLDSLGQRYGLGGKVEGGLAEVKGKRRSDLTQAQWRAFGEYAKQDVYLGSELFYAMRPKLPPAELWLIDTTVRMFTDPVFEGDKAVLDAALADEKKKKAETIARIVEWAGKPAPEPPPPAGTSPTDAAFLAKRKAARVARSRKPPPTPEEIAKKVLGSNTKLAALLVSLGEHPPTKYNDKGETIYAFAKDDPGMQELLESPREEIRLIAEARISVKSNVDETRITRMVGMASRGRMAAYLKFCGAHTHRWAGGDKTNWQNFRRGGQLRAAILAAPGWTMAVVDSGQIEARVAAWFAKESGLLASFQRNDAKTLVYDAAFAERVRELGHEPTKDEAKAIGRALALAGVETGDFYSDEGSKFFLMRVSKSETPTERQLSKNMILGLGFSMGWATFATNLLAGMLGSEPVQFTAVEATKFGVDVAAFESRKYGWGDDGKTCGQQVQQLIDNGARLSYDALLIHCAVAAHFTRRYRDSNKRIAQCWRTCEQVLAVMARPLEDGESPDVVRMDFGCLKVIHRGLVKPSGLTLHYPGLRKGSGGYVYKGGDSGREWVSVYGGKLFENIVQSLARDIVAEQMLRIRADGHRVAMCTHDEAVAVVPEAIGDQVLASALAHFRMPPSWCADLPLNAEGGVGRSYGAC